METFFAPALVLFSRPQRRGRVPLLSRPDFLKMRQSSLPKATWVTIDLIIGCQNFHTAMEWGARIWPSASRGLARQHRRNTRYGKPQKSRA